MILTILEAQVETGRWKDLEQAYSEVDKKSLPHSLLSSYLIQDQVNLKNWRIITIWKSKEDMDAYRKSVETPVWFLVFKKAGADPTLIISEVLGSK